MTPAKLGSWTYREVLPLLVRRIRLSLQNEFPAGPELPEHPVEDSFEAGVAPVELEPFGDAEAENDVELRLLQFNEDVTVQDVVALQSNEMDVIKSLFRQNLKKNDTEMNTGA